DGAVRVCFEAVDIDAHLVVDMSRAIPGIERDLLSSDRAGQVLRQNLGEVGVERLSPTINRRQVQPIGRYPRYHLLPIEIRRQLNGTHSEDERSRRGGRYPRCGTVGHEG